MIYHIPKNISRECQYEQFNKLPGPLSVWFAGLSVTSNSEEDDAEALTIKRTHLP